MNLCNIDGGDALHSDFHILFTYSSWICLQGLKRATDKQALKMSSGTLMSSCRRCELSFSAFQARFSVAASLRKYGGAIPERIGSWFTGVVCRQPEIFRNAAWMVVSILEVCLFLSHTGAQYSAAENTRAWVDNRSVFVAAPHIVPARLRIKEIRAEIFCFIPTRWSLKVSDLSSFTPRGNSETAVYCCQL